MSIVSIPQLVGLVKAKICFGSATEEDWDTMFRVNAKGTFLCYKYAGIQMIAQGRGGRIIGASSVSGKRGEPHKSPFLRV